MMRFTVYTLYTFIHSNYSIINQSHHHNDEVYNESYLLINYRTCTTTLVLQPANSLQIRLWMLQGHAVSI